MAGACAAACCCCHCSTALLPAAHAHVADGGAGRFAYPRPPPPAGRAAALRVHSRGMPLAADVDFEGIARRTELYSGALTEAAGLRCRRQRLRPAARAAAQPPAPPPSRQRLLHPLTAVPRWLPHRPSPPSQVRSWQQSVVRRRWRLCERRDRPWRRWWPAAILRLRLLRCAPH